jgi:hypothetical protein
MDCISALLQRIAELESQLAAANEDAERLAFDVVHANDAGWDKFICDHLDQHESRKEVSNG